jgi:hypothetical protein
MVAAGSSVTLVMICQTKRHNVPKHRKLQKDNSKESYFEKCQKV